MSFVVPTFRWDFVVTLERREPEAFPQGVGEVSELLRHA